MNFSRKSSERNLYEHIIPGGVKDLMQWPFVLVFLSPADKALIGALAAGKCTNTHTHTCNKFKHRQAGVSSYVLLYYRTPLAATVVVLLIWTLLLCFQLCRAMRCHLPNVHTLHPSLLCCLNSKLCQFFPTHTEQLLLHCLLFSFSISCAIYLFPLPSYSCWAALLPLKE